MAEDIIEKIDATLASMEANSRRFDPFGPGPRWFKSRTEEETVEPEVVVEVPGSDVALRPWQVGDRVSLADIRSRVPFSLPPEDYEALFGPMRATVTVATADEAAAATRRFRVRSLECGALTKSLRCSGCDGLAMEGGGVCFHECHDWLAAPDPPADELVEPDPLEPADLGLRWCAGEGCYCWVDLDVLFCHRCTAQPPARKADKTSWWSRLLPGRRTR